MPELPFFAKRQNLYASQNKLLRVWEYGQYYNLEHLQKIGIVHHNQAHFPFR